MASKLKPIHAALLLAILGVWGAIALQIADAVGDASPEPVMRPSRPGPAALTEGSAVFEKSIRDPFRWGALKRDTVRQAPPAVITEQPAWQPPPMRLIGIVMGKKGRTVVVESSEGEAAFLGVGDTLSGLKVLSIGPKECEYKFQGKTGSWTIE